ncbi:MAG: type II toxin-antitoxin system RelE/ParE family toxin [Bacteroidetes bacterium]|nr:type II toxin-antitoxin system RelE/ParE family toxin [Bacteroidota bacterium]MCL2328155.1 type II toxin-antitoxin system RelE/ParE family toxin [Bacteroidota bacterium]
MKREIIAYKSYYNEFINSLNEKEKQKLKYILLLLETSDRMPVKFMKLIRDGLFELRMEYNGNIYRLFFIFDGDRIVVLFNGFQKKTQKTPSGEIERALRLKNEYYEHKQSLNNEH